LHGKVSSRKSKTFDANAGDLKHLVGHNIKCSNGLIMYFVPGFLDEHPIMPNQDLNFGNMLVRYMFLLHNTLGEAYPANYSVWYNSESH